MMYAAVSTTETVSENSKICFITILAVSRLNSLILSIDLISKLSTEYIAVRDHATIIGMAVKGVHDAFLVSD